MEQPAARRSPWWYRQRGSVIGVIFGFGYAVGYWIPIGPAEPAAVVWGERLAGGPGIELLLWLAVASALVAWFWRGSGTALLQRDVVFAADVQSDRLIVAGVFRYVRNPLYLGNMFLALAAALLAAPLGFAIIVLGNVAFVVALAGEEAGVMAQRYGAVYAAFRAAVPAFVPRLTPAEVPGSVAVRPDWRAGLLGEAFCLALGVAIVPLALFGQAGLPAFYVIWIAALVSWSIAGVRAGRRRSASNVR